MSMIYKTLPGVVLGEICDSYILAASKEAREHCPYITQINETSAFLWRQMEKGASFEALLNAVTEEYEVEDEKEAETSIQAFLDQMSGMGYIQKSDAEVIS